MGSAGPLLSMGDDGDAILTRWLTDNIVNMNAKLPTSPMGINDYENMMKSYKNNAEPPYNQLNYDVNYGFDLARDLFIND